MRLLYFVYYLRKLDSNLFRKFRRYVKEEIGVSVIQQYLSIFYHSLKYNISILEYYQFHMYEIDDSQKSAWAGTGYMYEYQKVMNPPGSREILSDKPKFLDTYKDYIKHNFLKKNEIVEGKELSEFLKANERIVLKSSNGQCGRGIEIIPSDGEDANTIAQRMDESGNDMLEAFVVQHEDLMSLSPSGLNTVRIITQINKDGLVDILGGRLRITVDSSIDNLAAGNLAASIDIKTGMVIGKAVYSDITKAPVTHHPVTGATIKGFEVPFWKEALDTVKKAALAFPQNKSIGWDVAITQSGIDLIEGNHDWCKLLWQLPEQKGMKQVLQSYLDGTN